MRKSNCCLIIASLLAACGGGGPPASAPFSPSQGSSPAATLNYTQSATATSTGPAPIEPGFTCVSPQTVRTASATATISQSIASGQSFMGRGGLTAVTSSVALQGCADGSESFTETDYFTEQAGAPSRILLAGSALNYTTYIGMPRSVSVVYGGEGLIVAELPLQAGQSWTNAARRNVTAGSGDAYEETWNVNADGSYADNNVTSASIFPYQSYTTVENSDGSGTVTEIAGAGASAPPYTVTWSAPSANEVVFNESGTRPLPPDLPTPAPCPTPGGTPCPVVTPTPYPQYAWYPYDPSPATPLETIRSADKGLVTLPASCTVAKNLPSSAELIESVDSTLDVTGSTNAVTSDAYVDAHEGLLCLTVSMQRAQYVFGPSSADTTPVSTGTLTFSDSLQNETGTPPFLTIPTLSRLVTFYR